jgi:hypothetical protein
MPAIHLPRLKEQVEGLVEHYADPEKFARQLQDLYTYYGDKTRRPSQKAKKTVGLPSENIPGPVLKQIVAQMAPYAETAPHAILNLSRSLWQHHVLEYRLLAALLIGKIPVSHAEETLKLVQNWSAGNQEEQLLAALSTSGLSTLQQKDPDLLLERIEYWLAPEDEDLKKSEITSLQKLAVSVLVTFARDTSYENLPRLYALLKPRLKDAPKVLRPFLLEALLPLAARSPQEVAYILRSLLEDSPNQHLKWLVRRTIDTLPPENQERIKPLLTRQHEV